MTVFGLLSLIQFTTIENYLNYDTIIARSTGLTGPPLSEEAAKLWKERNIAAARIRIRAELKAETKGTALTVIGTIICAYGACVPLFMCTAAGLEPATSAAAH